jgi:predicted ATPase/tetratricopeptide (TPR) repeat protein
MSLSDPPSPTHQHASTGARWQVRLLGAVQARHGPAVVERFPSRAVAALLARLALAPDRAHGREELVELLWPGVELAVGRNRLRQALSTLKSLLEPAGQPGGLVLLADRLSVRVAPGALASDALAFEQALRAGRIDEATQLYRGELMPGYYDDWLVHERQRLAALHERLPPAGAPAMPVAAAPAASAAQPVPIETHLPHYLTRLFGAELPLARVRAQLRTHRLVTLLGPGGSGKTRLAVEVAQALAGPEGWAPPTAERGPRFERVAFVPLVACNHAAQMLAALAQALQLPARAAAGPAQAVAALAEALAGRTTLLVLDNFEQLVQADGGEPARAVAALLGALPRLHLLVSSRRALALDGECCVEAEPLPLPAQGGGSDAASVPLAEAAASPAVALFVDRARAARADFHLGTRNQAAVVALVRRLGGLPLAIELAASRVRSFAPAEMLRLLDDSTGAPGAYLALLARSGPRAGHDPRHASMAQVIAWSWRLLGAAERRLLHALGVFAADATTAALAQVLAEPAAEVLVRLDGLVAHSLVRADSGSADGDGCAPTRFGLVEPVREYVLGEQTPAEAATLRAALRRWLLGWAQGLGATLRPADVAAELRTVHAVLAAAAEAPRETLQIALALRGYWDTDGLPGALQGALEQALAQLPAHDPAGPALRCDLHEMLSYLRFEAGFAAQARDHADAAVAAAGEPGTDQPGISRRARALTRRAWIELAAGRGEDERTPAHERLQAWLDEALLLAGHAGDLEGQARALHQLAVLASHVWGDWRRAEAQLAQAEALWQQLGDRRKALARQRNRAQCWYHLGRSDEALASFVHCEQAAREEGDWVGQIDSLVSMTSLLTERRRWAEALHANRRCVALCWQRWHRHGLGYALWNPARVLARLRRPEPAMRLMAFAAAFWVRSFGPLGSGDRLYVRRVRRLVQAQVGAARAQALWLEGEGMDIGQAVALALAEG